MIAWARTAAIVVIRIPTVWVKLKPLSLAMMANSTDEIAAMDVSHEGAESQPPTNKKNNRPGTWKRQKRRKDREQQGAPAHLGPPRRDRADAWDLIGNTDAGKGGAATRQAFGPKPREGPQASDGKGSMKGKGKKAQPRERPQASDGAPSSQGSGAYSSANCPRPDQKGWWEAAERSLGRPMNEEEYRYWMLDEWDPSDIPDHGGPSSGSHYRADRDPPIPEEPDWQHDGWDPDDHWTYQDCQSSDEVSDDDHQRVQGHRYHEDPPDNFEGASKYSKKSLKMPTFKCAKCPNQFLNVSCFAYVDRDAQFVKRLPMNIQTVMHETMEEQGTVVNQAHQADEEVWFTCYKCLEEMHDTCYTKIDGTPNNAFMKQAKKTRNRNISDAQLRRWANGQDKSDTVKKKKYNVRSMAGKLIAKGNMGATDWNYALGQDENGKSVAWCIYVCALCMIAPVLANAWYRLVKCWSKMMKKDEYSNKTAMWHCASCIGEHKNMHDKRLLVLKKPDGTFMMDHVGVFSKDESEAERKINNGYQNKLRYLQLVSLCDTIVNKYEEEIELEEHEMLVIVEEVQKKCAYDLRTVQGLQTYYAKDPNKAGHTCYYSVTCTDRRLSLQGPGEAFQAIDLNSEAVVLSNWSVDQKRAIIDILLSMTDLSEFDQSKPKELQENKMKEVKKGITKSRMYPIVKGMMMDIANSQEVRERNAKRKRERSSSVPSHRP